MRLLIFGILLVGCETNTVVDKIENVTVLQDADGDGFLADEDCDDNDAQINSGASETCDSIDNDCDGQIDEDVTITFYQDADDDGFGNPDVFGEYCSAPEGYVPSANDCDDSNADIYVGNNELCDGLDNNCDGQIDEGMGQTYYLDADEDGYGDMNEPLLSCNEPAGYVLNATDCDDSSNVVYPNAPELCDGVDNNCNGATDNENLVTLYLDADGDGYGTDESVIEFCQPVEGYSFQGGDCDDSNSEINPAATEICDEADNDCDGIFNDDAIDILTWYLDSDADNFGDSSKPLLSCTQPSGYVSDATDCQDGEATVYPNAPEICDGMDNDCNYLPDDSDPNIQNQPTWYLDADFDTYGNDSIFSISCTAPPAYIARGGDCNDLNPEISPAAIEICDYVDNDCDDATDENVLTTFYADSDSDGYGDPLNTTQDCSIPSGYIDNAGDCNDLEALAFDDAIESCDGIDNDCNEQIDEGVLLDFYWDGDSDGYGDPLISMQGCSPLPRYVDNAEDCNDLEPLAYNGAIEVCDTVDNDCNGQTDEGVTTTWYLDLDKDGFGSNAHTLEGCTLPSADYSPMGNDCDDSDDAYNPDAALGCNNIDYNCDNIVDNDGDGDGYSDYDCGGSDCDDSDATIFPDTNGVCPLGTDCLDILQKGYTISQIYTIDPDGHHNGVDAEDVWCEQQLYGGGWTRIATNDPVNSLWNGTNIRDAIGFGDIENGDYKTEIAFTELMFTDLMFTDEIQYAVYENIGSGSETYYEFSASIPYWNCAPESGYEWQMTQGNLGGGNLCSTNLYFHAIDRDGNGNCNPYAQWASNSSGPTWSVYNNGGCPLDDASGTAFISATPNTALPWNDLLPLHMYIR